jgi:hypothetical protein
MNDPQLALTLKQLRLSGLATTLGVRLQEAAASRLSHAEFLTLIRLIRVRVRTKAVSAIPALPLSPRLNCCTLIRLRRRARPDLSARSVSK